MDWARLSLLEWRWAEVVSVCSLLVRVRLVGWAVGRVEAVAENTIVQPHI